MLVGCAPSSAIEKIVMLAIECSKPAAMKANRHHQIRMHFVASLVVRVLVHSARQTSQLHNAPRAISAVAEAPILAAEATKISAPPSFKIWPPAPSQKTSASSAEPARLP